MKIINASYEILTPITGDELKVIEQAGRTCYKSEDKITDESAKKFVKYLIMLKHEAMLEHSSLSVKFICDRGVSHELVRHRLASFAQESTRYCNYSQDKFGNEMTFIMPSFFGQVTENGKIFIPDDERGEAVEYWMAAMTEAEKRYFMLLNCGCTPQEARSVLPNSIKTEVIMTANYREWRHFLNLRAARATGPAHPQMEELAVPLLRELVNLIPEVFDDIYYDWISQKSDTYHSAGEPANRELLMSAT